MTLASPTPETVHEQIRQAKFRWICSMPHGFTPSTMYLGRLQNSALTARIENHVAEKHPNDSRLTIIRPISHRRQYEGMKIFVVDADSHIDFGREQVG